MQTITVIGRRVTPSKVVCIGRNYIAHIEELGNEIPDQMVVFNKPNSAISDILRSQIAGEPLHYEGELAFVIEGGKLAAVGFGLDLTKRTLEDGDIIMTGTPEGVGELRTGERFEGRVLAGSKELVTATWIAQ